MALRPDQFFDHTLHGLAREPTAWTARDVVQGRLSALHFLARAHLGQGRICGQGGRDPGPGGERREQPRLAARGDGPARRIAFKDGHHVRRGS